MIMVFASNGLRDAFEGQGEAGFIAWTYATCDTLEQVLAPGYFNSFRRFGLPGAYRPVGLHEAGGDLVHVGTKPRPASSPWTTRHQNTEVRRALLMAKGRDVEGRLHVRLVQDHGRPDDPDAPLAAAKRSRGRPAKAAAE